MMEEKTIYCSPSPRFFATTNILEDGIKKQIGLEKGPVRIYRKDETLFYSQNNGILGPDFPEGYTLIAFRTVGTTQTRLQVTIPQNWFKKYAIDNKKVSVDYQDIGLFVKPYHG